MRQILLSRFGFDIQAYSALLCVGAIAGIAAGTYAGTLRGLDAGRTLAALLALVLPAVAGSRLLFVAANWGRFRNDFGRVWRIAEGGASLYGGLILMFLVSGPLLGALLLPFGSFWDAVIITLLTGMVFTRVGCLLNGCCAGRPAHGPLSLCLPDHHGVWRRRMPTQILEGGLGGLLLIASIALWDRLPFPGAVALADVAAYSVGRWFLDSTREEASIDRIGSVNVNRAIAVGLVLFAASCWLYFGVLEPPAPETIAAASDVSWGQFLTAPLAILAVLLLFRVAGCATIAGLGGDYSGPPTTAPTFLSGSSAPFIEGPSPTNLFILAATGAPIPTLQIPGLIPGNPGPAPPSWLIFNPAPDPMTGVINSNTSVLTGSPPAGASSESPFKFEIIATNGTAPDAALNPFSVNVSSPPTSMAPMFQSQASCTMIERTTIPYVVTATGAAPITMTIDPATSLPPGVSFTQAPMSSGVATLGGTPEMGTGGTTSSGKLYLFNIIASNSFAMVPQTFMLTVLPPPPSVFTSTILSDNPVAFWPLNETNPPVNPSGGTAVDLVGPSPGNNPGTYILPANPIAAIGNSPAANPIELNLGQPSLLPDPSTSDSAVNLQGGCVQVPWASVLNPPNFTLEAVVSAGWDFTVQNKYLYGLLSSVGASAKTGFAIFGAPCGFPLGHPTSEYHWLLAVGTGAGFAFLSPQDFAFNPATGGLMYTGADPGRTGDTGPQVLSEVTYLAFTFDGTNYTLYIQSESRDIGWARYPLVPPASGNYVPVPMGDQANLYIGREVSTAPPALFPFTGEIEGIAIYDSALASGTIATHIMAAIFG